MWASANPYLKLGLAAEPVAWVALGLSGAALALGCSQRARVAVRRAPTATLLALMSSSAALLSWGYIVYYLRGGPRIVDAAHYALQARALAHGFFTFPTPEPLASFNGRFLLADASGHRLAVLFPPGYPAALALATLSGAPLALGPLLAAALVLLSYLLARELGATRDVCLGAALLSVLSAALRYHTADTMSHGFAATLVAAASVALLRGSPGALLASGLATGWLCATRPVTGVVVLACSLGFALLGARRAHSVWLLLGLLPGLAFFAFEQSAVSGRWLGSSQLSYYARADGPPGCFRYGFGAGIGCLFEHGDYVRARLPAGYGLWQAAATTVRRALVHSIDIANAAPLALGVPLGAWLARRERGYALIALITLGIAVGYAPFYFEASYPGGGARLLCDALPLEHVLLASALVALHKLRFAWPAALLGFAVHAHNQHAALRDREGGRPMFERELLERRGVRRGLVFVNTDHGFALGHQPGVLSAREGLVVARQRFDALDRLLWEKLGRPASYRYAYDPSNPHGPATLSPWSPPNSAAKQRVEAESLWPPLSVVGGWAHPDFVPHGCSSRSRGLRAEPTTRTLELRLLVPAPEPNSAFVMGAVGVPPTVEVERRQGTNHKEWVRLDWKTQADGCARSVPVVLGDHMDDPWLTLRTSAGLIDYLEYTLASTEKGVDN